MHLLTSIHCSQTAKKVLADICGIVVDAGWSERFQLVVAWIFYSDHIVLPVEAGRDNKGLGRPLV